MKMTAVKIIVFGLFFGFGAVAWADSGKLLIGNFAQGEMSGWEPMEFTGQTEYAIIEKDDALLLQAKSKESASGLVKKIRVDLWEYPYLNWSWQVEKPLTRFNEQQKSGDDFAARIYVVIDGGIFFWNKKAINYVWAGNSIPGKVWPSPYAGKNSMMMAVRWQKDLGAGFVFERRNLYKDLRQVFGEEIRYIDAVALMTDSDDRKEEAIAYYGNIYFSKK